MIPAFLASVPTGTMPSGSTAALASMMATVGGCYRARHGTESDGA